MIQPVRPKFHVKVFFSLLCLALILVFLHLLFQHAPRIWNDKFNLDQEANVPTWFATALLLAVALCAFALHRAQEETRPGRCFARLFWLGFSFVYVLFSLDEAAGFHEMSVHWAGPIRFALFAVVAGAFFAACVYNFLVLRREARHLAGWILPGMGIYFLGAIGLETLNAFLSPLIANFTSLEIIAEEGMELLGTIMVFTGCLAELSRLGDGRLGQIFQKRKMPRYCLIQGAAFSLAALALATLAGLVLARNTRLATIPMLQHKVESAWKNKKYDRALLIDQILLKRFTRLKNTEGVFELRLDIASLEYKLGNKEEARRMLRTLRGNHQRDVQKTARIALAQSRVQEDQGNLTEAVSLLEEVRLDSLLPGTLYDVTMSLAGLYVDAERWAEAERLYTEMVEMFSASPIRRSSASLALARIYMRRGEIEKASESLSRVSPPFLGQDLFFRVQSQLALRFLQGKRYEEALGVYESLAERLKDNPRLFPQVREQIKILRRKLERN
jgi:tetratricopeptide (TPR) repeat protein